MQNLHIGTCSWKYESWEGLVYQADSDEEYLAQYARKYDTVEVDQWFWSLGKQSYRLPDPLSVRSYVDDTPDEFRFTIKCPNTLTLPTGYASKTEKNPWFLDAEVFYRFLEMLEPMVSKIGLLMFQFGYLNRTMFAGRSAFLDSLQHFFTLLPDGIPYAVEIRNPAWMDASYFTILKEMHVGPVLLSGYWMDDIATQLERAESHLQTPFCIRLHGQDRKAIEQESGGIWNGILENHDNELMAIAPRIVKLAQEGKVIYINVNNHYEGSAPMTIVKLLDYLKEHE
ncbi:MAG: DUF72 domain-containing protein [Sphaerochaeta sp.]